MFFLYWLSEQCFETRRAFERAHSVDSGRTIPTLWSHRHPGMRPGSRAIKKFSLLMMGYVAKFANCASDDRSIHSVGGRKYLSPKVRPRVALLLPTRKNCLFPSFITTQYLLALCRAVWAYVKSPPRKIFSSDPRCQGWTGVMTPNVPLPQICVPYLVTSSNWWPYVNAVQNLVFFCPPPRPVD